MRREVLIGWSSSAYRDNVREVEVAGNRQIGELDFPSGIECTAGLRTGSIHDEKALPKIEFQLARGARHRHLGAIDERREVGQIDAARFLGERHVTAAHVVQQRVESLSGLHDGPLGDVLQS